MSNIAIFWLDERFWSERCELDGGLDLAHAVQSLFEADIELRQRVWQELDLPDGVIGAVGGAWALQFESAATELLQWTRGSLEALPYYESGLDLDVEQLFSTFRGDSRRPTARPVSILFTRSEDPSALPAAELADAIARLLKSPDLQDEAVANVGLHRPIRLEFDSDIVMIAGFSWLYRWVDADEPLRRDLLSQFEEAADPPPPRLRETRLVLDAFVIDGLELPVSPGVANVLFGPNGAGKSLLIESAAAALATVHGIEHERGGLARLANRTHVAMRDPNREGDGDLWSFLLAHLGWCPLTDFLDPRDQVILNSMLPSWTALTERPSDSEGIPVSRLIMRSADELRPLVVATVMERAPWKDRTIGAKLMSAALTAGLITVDSKLEVGLTVSVDDLPQDVIDDGLALFEHLTSGGAVEDIPNGAHQALTALARTIASGEQGGTRFGGARVLGVLDDAQQLGLNVAEESGWPAAGREFIARLRSELPVPVHFDAADADDGVDVAEAPLLTLLEKLHGEIPSQHEVADSHPFAGSPLTERLALLLGLTATLLLPAFVQEAWHVRVQLLPPVAWHRRRVETRLVPPDGGDGIPLATAPAGARAWTSATIRFAAALLVDAVWKGEKRNGTFELHPDEIGARTGEVRNARKTVVPYVEPDTLTPSTRTPSHVLFVLDEPEAHLHLSAQSDAAAATRHLASLGHGALVASHSLAFLDDSDATLATIVRPGTKRPDIDTRIGLSTLTKSARQLGIPPSAAAMACRGVLVVEGMNDEFAIRQYCGVDLDRHFVTISQLDGHHGAVALAELEFLASLRVPVFVLLDHVRRTRLERLLDGEHHQRWGEERTLQTLHNLLTKRGHSAWSLPFAKADIVYAVPETEVNRALERRGLDTFIGWRSLEGKATERWKRDRTKFKDVFRETVGISVEELFRDLRVDPQSTTSPELKALVSTMLEIRDTPPTPGLHVLNPYQK